MKYYVQGTVAPIKTNDNGEDNAENMVEAVKCECVELELAISFANICCGFSIFKGKSFAYVQGNTARYTKSIYGPAN